MTTRERLIQVKNSAPVMSALSSKDKNLALFAMADSLLAQTESILAANQLDMQEGMSRLGSAMLDRLRLDPERIKGMASGIREVAALPDPVGCILEEFDRPNGLHICKQTVPMGVIGIIYESRPNVTSDAAALAIKAGSVCVLRCGKDAWNSCHAIVAAMQNGLEACSLPKEALCLIEDTTHASANELMTANGLVDLLIPRGGKNLIQACIQNATVPCIQTGTGICHIYVDQTADLKQALRIIENAKTSRPSVCNAAEVCLVHRDIAEVFLPQLRKTLCEDREKAGKVPVELRLDSAALQLIEGTPAGPEDFDTEFLDYILAVRVVNSVDEAIDHISRHSTHHSEAILTADAAQAKRFASSVDSAAVYINASTRFTDGGEFGLGCEMGISTQKLHARGPMGLRELCSYKYIITGNGQIR